MRDFLSIMGNGFSLTGLPWLDVAAAAWLTIAILLLVVACDKGESWEVSNRALGRMIMGATGGFLCFWLYVAG